MIKVFMHSARKSIQIFAISTRLLSHTQYNGNTKIITEQSAELVSSDGANVFYNHVQEFNRDLSVAVLNVYFKQLLKERELKKSQNNVKQHNAATVTKTVEKQQAATEQYLPGQRYEDGMRILEALSATGLRSVRYAKEVSGVREIVANDFSTQAVESMHANFKHNKVEELVTASEANAMTLMYMSTAAEKRFDVIDLDPYGCPNRFLDGAIQSLNDGGLLLVTATDMAVLSGNAPEACFAKYGTVPLRMKCCHEMALRILLHCIAGHANRYGKYIVPLLSISADFYIRIFVRVFSNQAQCKYSMSQQSMIYQCIGCATFSLQPLGILKPKPTEKNPQQVKFGIPMGPTVNTSCEHCGSKHHLGGPFWTAPIHDYAFVQEILEAVQQPPLAALGTQKRIVGMLSMILEELPDVPLYYSLDQLCSVLKLEIMPMLRVRSALLHAGHRVSYSHAYRNSIKTDAPAAVLWDILRCWQKLHPVKPERLLEEGPLKAILSREITKEYNIDDVHPEANPNSRKKALSRFQENPAPFWGPGSRASNSAVQRSEGSPKKSRRNQNKKQKRKINDDETVAAANADDGDEAAEDAIVSEPKCVKKSNEQENA